MKLRVTHTLAFSLGTPLRAQQHLLLTPLSTPQQKVEHWSIDMLGIQGAAQFRDACGNRAHLVTLLKPEEETVVTVTGAVETVDKAGVLGRLEYDPMPAIFRRPTENTKPDPRIVDGLKDGPDRIALFHELMGRTHEVLGAGSQTQTQGGQTQSQGTATPVDHAHALIGALRSLNIPARYVTGYLLDDGKATFHSWTEAWDDRLGWIDFDATLNVCPAEQHVRLASGLDAMTTLPIRSVPVWGEMPRETVTIETGE